MKLGLFIFTRDLRLTDNIPLIEALKNSDKVLPIFIFTKIQTSKNKRFNSNSFQFMVECLEELEEKIPIQFFYGSFIDIVKSLNKTNNFDAIYISKDYTPYAKHRENELKKIHNNVIILHNHTLTDIDAIKSQTDTDYVMYSPFKNKFKSDVKVPKPLSNKYTNYYTKIQPNAININKIYHLYTENPNIFKGGRTEGMKILANLKQFKKYNQTRNIPSIQTTQLSAHNKFGTVSIREVYYRLIKINKELVDQLIWREFYYYVLNNNQTVLTQNFNPNWDTFKWNSTEKLKIWERGITGFPIVDAGMRQLNSIGYMHNRVRLITANFLTKNLHIHWKHGEKYFGIHLVDYDPAQNNGNWQWCASTGVDPLRYGKPRIMNPWLQQLKYDKDCKYIKKWIPELDAVPNKDIHKWYDKHIDYKIYYKPCVDFRESINGFMRKFKQIKN